MAAELLPAMRKSKKVIDLGNGTSFNVSSYSGYQKFTVDNFIVLIQQVNAGTYGYVYTRGTTYVYYEGLGFSKTYNASSGILSVSVSGGKAVMKEDGYQDASGTPGYILRCYLVV